MGFDRPEPAYVPLGCERTFDGQNGLDCRKPVKMMVQVFKKNCNWTFNDQSRAERRKPV